MQIQLMSICVLPEIEGGVFLNNIHENSGCFRSLCLFPGTHYACSHGYLKLHANRVMISTINFSFPEILEFVTTSARVLPLVDCTPS